MAPSFGFPGLFHAGDTLKVLPMFIQRKVELGEGFPDSVKGVMAAPRRHRLKWKEKLALKDVDLFHLQLPPELSRSSTHSINPNQSADPSSLIMTATSSSRGESSVESSSIRHCLKDSILAQSCGIK